MLKYPELQEHVVRVGPRASKDRWVLKVSKASQATADSDNMALQAPPAMQVLVLEDTALVPMGQHTCWPGPAMEQLPLLQ